MKYGLSKAQLDEIVDILASYAVIEEAVLFGSRVLNTYKESSDIDIAIKGSQIPLTLAAKVKYHFEEETYLPFFVDIVDYTRIDNEAFFEHIDTKGITIYRRGWKKYKLGNVISLEYGKGLQGYRDAIGKYDVFGTNGKIGKTDKYLYDQPSIIIGRKGAYRGVHLAPTPFFVIDTAFYTKILVENVDAFFLYYWFKGIDINEMDSGSAIPSTSRDEVYDLDIELPPLPEQRAIAAVLSALDDKIDLLQRQNKTLEDLAQTLFRQWFVEDVQADWEEKSLVEVASYLNGLACQKHPPKNEIEKLPVLKIKELRNGISDQSDWATNEVPEEYIVDNGDVIFSWSGSLMVKIWDGGKCILNQHLFKVTSDQYQKWFYYFWTIHHLEKFIAIADSKATTMGHIKRTDLSSSMALIPNQSELDQMNQVLTPLIDKMILNNQQTTKLTTLHDTLLPKLMSGEVRVRM